MNPSFEKRVRGFAIDTSGAMLMIIILGFGIRESTVRSVLISAVVLGFYFVPYFFSKGQTFGKRIQKTKIVNVDGSDVSLWKVLLRDFFKLSLSIATFGVYMVIAFFVLSEKSSQTIHDKIFRTKVIDLEVRQGSDRFINTTESLRKKGL